MTKLFKRISAVAMAAAMATTMAVSASAVTATTPAVSTPYGTMRGYLTVTEDSLFKYVTGKTTCTTEDAPMICVGIAIVSYPEGRPLYEYNNTTVIEEYKSSVSTGAYSVSKDPITAYGSHEIRGRDGYGKYTELINV